MTFERLMRLSPDELAVVNRQRDRYFPIRPIRHGAFVRSLDQDRDIGPVLDSGLMRVDEFMTANRVAGLLVLGEGRIRLERYGLGLKETDRWSSFSVGKSVTGIMVGLAVQDGFIRDLDEPVGAHVPELASSAYGESRVGDLVRMSSGMAWREGYRDGQSDIARMYEAVFARRKGGIVAVLGSLSRAAPPGSQFLYSTGETHLLGEIIARASGRPLAEYLSERVWSVFGMEADGYWTLESPNGQELAGGGVNFVLRDYGRFGQFVLEGGVVDGTPLLPVGWLDEATRPDIGRPHLDSGRLYDGYPFGYGHQWWLYHADGGKWPEHAGAFTGMGIFGQFLYVNPARAIVAVILSAWPDPWVAENERRVHEFLAAIVRTMRA